MLLRAPRLLDRRLDLRPERGQRRPQLVRGIGGKIVEVLERSVESAIGVGTTFTIEIAADGEPVGSAVDAAAVRS